MVNFENAKLGFEARCGAVLSYYSKGPITHLLGEKVAEINVAVFMGFYKNLGVMKGNLE